MIVQVHSLGSLWQIKDLPNGGTKMWNTTGIREGESIRSRACVFGQVHFAPRAKPFFHDLLRLRTRLWNTGDLYETDSGIGLRLICPADRRALPEWHLAAITHELVGVVKPGSYDPKRIALLSMSVRNGKQELLVLARAYGWIAGSQGSATFDPGASPEFPWRINKW